MWTKALDPAVKPIPVLQILNVLAGLFGLCWEYPLPILIPNTALHRSIAARLFLYPISVVLAALIYQGTNAAIYYLVGLIVYFWGYTEGEVSHTTTSAFNSSARKLTVDICRLFACHGKSPHAGLPLPLCRLLINHDDKANCPGGLMPRHRGHLRICIYPDYGFSMYSEATSVLCLFSLISHGAFFSVWLGS